MPRRPLAPLALAAVTGAALGPQLPPATLSGACLLGALAPLLMRPRRRPPALTTAALLLAVAGLTGLRAAQADRALQVRARLQPPPGPCVLRGHVAHPATRDAFGGHVVELRQGSRRVQVLAGGPVPLGPVRALGRWRTLDLERKRRLARRGLDASFVAAVVLLDGSPERLGWLDAIKRHTRRLVAAGVAPDHQALIAAVLLGDPPALSLPLRRAFRRSGTAHLLSLSGLHVGLLAGLALALCRLGRIPWRQRPLVILLVLLGYLALAGPRIPTLRATLAGCVFFLAPHRGDSWNRLSGAGLVVLLWDPLALWDVGLQLSFGTVAGILALARPLERGLLRARRGGLLASWLVAALAAFLSATPLLAITLGQLPLASVVVGAPAVTVFTVVLALAVVAAAAGAFVPALGVAIFRLSDAGCALLVTLVDAGASWGWDLALPAPPPAWLSLPSLGLLALGASRRERGASHACHVALGGALLVAAILSAWAQALL